MTLKVTFVLLHRFNTYNSEYMTRINYDIFTHELFISYSPILVQHNK